jgi:hypothetical protein
LEGNYGMTLADDIRSALRSTVEDLSEVWYYRKITSLPGVEPRTYDAAWTEIDGLATAVSWAQEYDEQRDAQVLRHRARLRVPDSVTALVPGDQVKDSSDIVWAVSARESSAYGSIAYAIMREKPMLAEADRGGGV